ncbi:DUF4340 domain-containing protein [Sandaracinus amylolyticus]|uniref:DUF4340 domain-containing protein n=1 Tax=Sandaracinus amylolyticus TaxID=927083 RepID=A0A0F6YIP8_9BACT|nr:DUF4340 domain-containing protein [Sandaracinus amylolyticus]AKF06420.1 hypothetical protein DB32_003569 [Sandaracinus amylolyticus]
MSKRTTIVLGVIALAMALFIGIFESGMLSTGELEARRGRVLQRFVRPRVSDVELVSGETRIVLHRDREEDLDEFELGHWQLTAPIASDADQDAVDQLLSSLEWLEARRSLSGISDEDRARFGLAEPRATVRFTVAGEDVTVVLGGEDPRGDGVYVGVSDRPGEAFVVGQDFVEALQHDVAHFRRKELFDSVRSADVSAVELSTQQERARVERTEGGWMLREPYEALARTASLEEIFSMTREVRATRFLDDGDLARHGLDQPSRELVIRRERAEDEANRAPLRLRIGGACPGREAEVVARVGDEGPIVCVTAESISTLDLGVDRLRESRLVAMRDDEMERAEIDGDADYQLRREDMSWQIVQGEDARAADDDAVADWTREMRALEALAYEPATDEALRARGLAAPRATITLHRSDQERSERVALGTTDGDGVWVRRGDDPQIARFPLAAVELLTAPAIRFRDRRLVRDVETNAQDLVVLREGVEERVQKRGTEWRVTTPVEIAADGVVTRDVVRAIASLTAVRFVADRASAEHGLERPRFVVTATFEGALPDEDDGADEHDHEHGEHADEEETPPRVLVLRIGAATEGGAFAQLGEDPAVLVVASELIESLEGPLASRDLLAVESSELESLALVRGGERVELRREGDGWTAGQGPADEARTTLILDRLASMRAVGTTRYGEPAPADGMASPVLVLEIRRRSGSPEQYELRVGAPGAAGADGWYHARRSDLAVGFRLGAAVVRAFLDYQP